ncbi:MAG: sodium/proline symporter [Chlamydiota bacterium]
MSIAYLGAFGTYFSVLASIVFFSYYRQKIRTDTDFLVGNRSMNFWVTALSAHASDMSTWLFMAFPAAIYLGGLYKSWVALGLILGMFLNWHFIAPKLRRVTEQYNCVTLSAYFERRFKDSSGTISIMTASLALFFFTVYLAAGLVGMGLLFESVFNIPYNLGITIGITVVLLYTFLGGFITVAYADLFQGTFLLFMIILVPLIVFFRVGGSSAISVAAAKAGVSMFIMPDTSLKSIFSIILTTLEWGLGYFGQLHILAKFMGIRRVEDMYKSKYLGISWLILTLMAATAVGLVGLAYYGVSLTNPELVFVEMVKGTFTPFFAGLVLCAILAAIISTMDSQVLVISSVLTEDIYKKFIRSKAGHHELLYVSRAAVLLACVLSFFFAYGQFKSVYDLVFYAWAGLGCSFGPVLIMSFYSKTINKFGAIAGILTGGLIVACWNQISIALKITIPPMVPGFFLSLGVIYFVSKLTRRYELHR